MGVSTTRLFALAALSIFALMVMHNALNLQIADDPTGRRAALRRPMLLAPRDTDRASEFAQPPRARPAQRAFEQPTHASNARTLSAAAPPPRVVPWEAPLLPPSRNPSHNYTDCTPRPGTLGPTRPLEYIVPPESDNFPANCDRDDLKELCEVVSRVAIRREVLTAVCNSKIIGQLENFLSAVEKAGIQNVMIIALDQALVDWLAKRGVAYYKKISTAKGSHKISAQKFRIVREFLEVGCSVLMSDIDIVWLRNPFSFMWRDTDLEGATDGWDWETAYGWTEHLDDATMGSARAVEGYRITAFNSGLWYLQATRAGLRMMQLLAHRMETEDTWDQTAFSQESTLPTHDDWLNAGLSVRVMNHMCFCNSKTLLRAIRPSKALQGHTPVVVHVNYHQSKEMHMIDINARYHGGQLDALERTARKEPRTLRPIAEVEAPFWMELNDGFVAGAHVQPSMQAVKAGGCAPLPPKNAFLERSPGRAEQSCDESDQQRALCEKLSAVGARGEVLLVVLTRANARALPLFAEAAGSAGVRNVLLLAHDESAQPAADAAAAAVLPSQAARESGLPWMALADALPARALEALPEPALRWAALRQALLAGYGVLLLQPSVVLVTNPFAALYRDADLEVASAGWDDPSSYGYNHVLDDPSMGFTRFCHGSRIVARDPAVVYGAPSEGAVRFAGVLAMRLATEARQPEPRRSERELLSEELWLPSAPTVSRAGAQSRVMNYLCFANAKVLWRTLNRIPALRTAHTPVLVSLADTSELLARMRAVRDRYHGGKLEALDAFPIGDSMPEFSAELCDSAKHLTVAAGAAESVEWLRRVTSTPWTWSGVKEVNFDPDGGMRTPWGKGSWALVPAKENMISATFIGRQHLLLFSWTNSRAQFVSSRCDDADVVLGRPVAAS